jgi:hypothetical protein
LLMDAVAQPTPFLLQFLGKTRPRTQFDPPWIGDMQPSADRIDSLTHHGRV